MKRILLAASVLAAAVASLAAASALAGKPAPATLTFNPTSHDFGVVQPGSSSSSVEFVLTYTGKGNSGTLHVGSLVEGWTIVSDGCSGTSLSNNETCSVTLKWQPTSYGLIGDDTLRMFGRKLTASATLAGGTSAPPCAAGSENFSGFDTYDRPTMFSGGTIDTTYPDMYGGIVTEEDGWGSNGQFPSGTHYLFTGRATSFQLTFTAAVSSVQLDAQSDTVFDPTTETLTAYDGSDSVVDTDSATSTFLKNTLAVTSTSNNIKYFTIATDASNNWGLVFTNISWTCA